MRGARTGCRRPRPGRQHPPPPSTPGAPTGVAALALRLCGGRVHQQDTPPPARVRITGDPHRRLGRVRDPVASGDADTPRAPPPAPRPQDTRGGPNTVGPPLGARRSLVLPGEWKRRAGKKERSGAALLSESPPTRMDPMLDVVTNWRSGDMVRAGGGLTSRLVNSPSMPLACRREWKRRRAGGAR